MPPPKNHSLILVREGVGSTEAISEQLNNHGVKLLGVVAVELSPDVAAQLQEDDLGEDITPIRLTLATLGAYAITGRNYLAGVRPLSKEGDIFELLGQIERAPYLGGKKTPLGVFPLASEIELSTHATLITPSTTMPNIHSYLATNTQTSNRLEKIARERGIDPNRLYQEKKEPLEKMGLIKLSRGIWQIPPTIPISKANAIIEDKGICASENTFKAARERLPFGVERQSFCGSLRFEDTLVYILKKYANAQYVQSIADQNIANTIEMIQKRTYRHSSAHRYRDIVIEKAELAKLIEEEGFNKYIKPLINEVIRILDNLPPYKNTLRQVCEGVWVIDEPTPEIYKSGDYMREAHFVDECEIQGSHTFRAVVRHLLHISDTYTSGLIDPDRHNIFTLFNAPKRYRHRYPTVLVSTQTVCDLVEQMRKGLAVHEIGPVRYELLDSMFGGIRFDEPTQEPLIL